MGTLILRSCVLREMASTLDAHVNAEVLKFLKFTRRKRLANLREVDGMFDDFVEDDLTEATYTRDEVVSLIRSLQRHVRTDVSSELTHVAHVTTVLLQQLHAQATKWYLRLSSDLAQLDDASLLAAVAAFESSHLSGQGAVPAALAPPEAFSDESLGLLRNRIAELEATVASLADEKDALQSSVRDLSSGLVSDENALAAAHTVIEQLKAELAAGKETIARQEAALAQSVQGGAAGGEGASGPGAGVDAEEVESLKTELLEAQAQERAHRIEVEQLRAELDAKVSKTSPFLSLKKMLRKKNDLIKSLRAQIAGSSEP